MKTPNIQNIVEVKNNLFGVQEKLLFGERKHVRETFVLNVEMSKNWKFVNKKIWGRYSMGKKWQFKVTKDLGWHEQFIRRAGTFLLMQIIKKVLIWWFLTHLSLTNNCNWTWIKFKLLNWSHFSISDLIFIIRRDILRSIWVFWGKSITINLKSNGNA